MADESPSEQPENESDSAAPPEPNDAAGQQKYERKQGRIRREKAEADSFWTAVMESAVGRREMWRLIAGPDAGHAFDTRFMSGSVGFPDPNATWYARGEQEFALRFYHELLRRSPAQVALMHVENDHRFAVAKRSKASE